MLTDNRAKVERRGPCEHKGTLTCPLRGAILTRSRKQDGDRNGQLVRQGASQSGVAGSVPPAVCEDLPFTGWLFTAFLTCATTPPQSRSKSTIHKNTSHAQCNAEHRDGAVLCSVKRMMQCVHARRDLATLTFRTHEVLLHAIVGVTTPMRCYLSGALTSAPDHVAVIVLFRRQSSSNTAYKQ